MNRASAIIVTVLLGLIAPAAAFAGASVTVTLKSEAYVSGRCIMLGDVATMSGDAVLSEKVTKIMLRRTPAARAPEQITVERVRDRLEANGIAAENVKFAGAAKVNAYNAEFYKEEAAKAAADAAASKSASTATQPASVPTAQPAPTATDSPKGESTTSAANVVSQPKRSVVDIAIEEICSKAAAFQNVDRKDIIVDEKIENEQLKNLPGGVQAFLGVVDDGKVGGPLGRRSFVVQVEVDGKPIRNLKLTLLIKQMVDVVVAVKPLVAGRAITADDVAVKPQAFAASYAQNYRTLAEVIDMTLKSGEVAVGAQLTLSMLKPAIVIKRGELVNVTVQTAAGVRIAYFSAPALTDGAKGQTIKVERKTAKAGDNGTADSKDKGVQVDVVVTGAGRATVTGPANVSGN